MVQDENIIMQSGYKESFMFYEIFWLLSQILNQYIFCDLLQ